MKLEQISISNFKGLKTAEVAFNAFDCLVGENNSGKSSVLQSVVWALGRSGTLPNALYYDQTKDVEFKILLTGIERHDFLRLAPAQSEKIQDIVISGKLQLIVRFSPNEKCETLALRRVARAERFKEDAIAAVLQGKRGIAIIRAVQENYPEFAADLPPNVSSAAEGISFFTNRSSSG